MCGIAGWVGGQDFGPDVLERAGDLLRHRGPDDDGYETGPAWGLAFRRLSILDLSPQGHQPMFSRDGKYVLVFNGEIYNYVELRRDLEQEGYCFRSGSDTEVLLYLLARHGAAGVRKLNGMFALAFIDTSARTFILARDRLGVKPLFYMHSDSQIRFASEMKALLAWPDAARQIHPVAVVDYLALGYVPGAVGIFTGYSKLEPGCVLCGLLDAAEDARVERYWQLSINDDPSSRRLTAAEGTELDALLTDAVRIRLRSDVPVGLFLSGGIDSGLIAAAASEISGPGILALTVGFDDRDADETMLARSTAQHVGLEHVATVQACAQLADLDRLAWFYDEPFGDPSALPLFALCKVAAQHATVFLSGDGGDEGFGGYQRYIEGLRYRRLFSATGRLGAGLRQAERLLPRTSTNRYRLRKLSLPNQGGAAAFDGIPNDPALQLVLHPELKPLFGEAGRQMWRQWSGSRSLRNLTARQQQLDYAMYLPDDVLTKTDRASMAHSIEVRSPFLDYRLVEWAARLPRSALLNDKEGKLPLRALAGRSLPPAVARGGKRGFSVPLDPWFRSPAGVALVHERLLSTTGRQLGFWDADQVETMLARHRSGRGRPFGVLFWRLLMLEAWSRHYAASRSPGGVDSRSGDRRAAPSRQLAQAS